MKAQWVPQSDWTFETVDGFECKLLLGIRTERYENKRKLHLYLVQFAL
jgi:hypothetical protein